MKLRFRGKLNTINLYKSARSIYRKKCYIVLIMLIRINIRENILINNILDKNYIYICI